MSVNKKSIENLKSFTKGGKAPKGAGRPPGSLSTKTRINQLLDVILDKYDNPITEEKGKFRTKDLILMSQIKSALDGNLKSAEFLLDRTDGKVTDKVEHSGELDTTYTINIQEKFMPKKKGKDGV